MKKKAAVLYHANCYDGFGGAWAAWKALKKDAEYFPVEHHVPPPVEAHGRDVYLIDFCYSQKEMDTLLKKNTKLVVLDHHVSQQAVVTSMPEYTYALDHSGCVLAWNYFHAAKPVPKLLLSIEDNDLFTFKRPHTKEFFVLLQTYQFDFTVWDRLVKDFENTSKREIYRKRGGTLLSYKDKIVEQIASEAEKVVFEGHKAYAANTPIYYSEAANRFFSPTYGCHVGISWYYRDGTLHVSLRSDGSVDVSKLAQKYGGGGHKAASGFVFPFKGVFPWKRRK
ncbi:MAG: DHHA1 domain-containing protein [bacterium]|nr:DHHA1 domain-containing protein [bacterium]